MKLKCYNNGFHDRQYQDSRQYQNSRQYQDSGYDDRNQNYRDRSSSNCSNYNSQNRNLKYIWIGSAIVVVGVLVGVCILCNKSKEEETKDNLQNFSFSNIPTTKPQNPLNFNYTKLTNSPSNKPIPQLSSIQQGMIYDILKKSDVSSNFDPFLNIINHPKTQDEEKIKEFLLAIKSYKDIYGVFCKEILKFNHFKFISIKNISKFPNIREIARNIFIFGNEDIKPVKDDKKIKEIKSKFYRLVNKKMEREIGCLLEDNKALFVLMMSFFAI